MPRMSNRPDWVNHATMVSDTHQASGEEMSCSFTKDLHRENNQSVASIEPQPAFAVGRCLQRSRRLAVVWLICCVFATSVFGQDDLGDDELAIPAEVSGESGGASRLEELMKQLEALDRQTEEGENERKKEADGDKQTRSSGTGGDKDDSDDSAKTDDDSGYLNNADRRILPKVSGGRFELPQLSPPSLATDSVGNGSVPDGFGKEEGLATIALPQAAAQRPYNEGWAWTQKLWAAPNTFSNPRYFEDRMLERHGQTRWGHLQPVVAGARFFTTIPMLPYKATIEPPCECQYTLGYLRPGSCQAAYVQRPPWDRRAILAESTAVAAGMLILP